MMIRKTLREFDPRAELAETIFKTVRRSDSTKGADIGVREPIERQLFAGINILQIKRLVRALNDLGGAVVTPDALDQFIVRLAGAIGDEDVARAAKISGRLAQGAPREQKFIPERRLPVDQHDVQTMFQMQVLQAIIEQKCIGSHLANCVQPALHAVLVDQDNHILQVMREHVRLVAGGKGIQQERLPIGNNPRRIGGSPAEPIEPAALGRFRDALVATAQDGDAPPAGLERPRKFFDDRRLTGATNGQVADANDKTTQSALAENTFPIEKKPQLDNARVD